MDAVTRDALVDAWDRGYEAAYEMARGWGHVDWWEEPYPENPFVGEGVVGRYEPPESGQWFYDGDVWAVKVTVNQENGPAVVLVNGEEVWRQTV